MHKALSYTLLYVIPAALIGYGIWQNLLALIAGASWIATSFIIFELPKRDYE